MGNSDYDELLRDYTVRLTGLSDEANLIKSVPWSLGGPGGLHRSAQGIATRSVSIL